MSRRLNLSGFSIPTMRALCGSRDESILSSLQSRIDREFRGPSAPYRADVTEVVRRAVFDGVPFGDLTQETLVHSFAADLLAEHGQKWLSTDASAYGASALEEGLWAQRKYASREARAFLSGLVKGIPLFGGAAADDGSAYAMVSLAGLRAFQPHLRDLAEGINYRVAKKKSADDEDRYGAQFATEFCGWIDEIVAAERDLYCGFG